jgi:2-oxoglutarate dehydrogenase E2 component (dihydrolipoamide succinyltransferase)
MIEVRVPQLPESVTDATLVAWRKKAGDRVVRDENLVDLETDKVVLEVPAPADGILAEIKVSDGSTVTSGDVLAVVNAEAAAKAAPAAPEAPGPATPASSATSAAPARRAAPPQQPAAAAQPAEDPAARAEAQKRLSPSVRRLVEQHGIDTTAVSGSGRSGRITKSDVVALLDRDSGTDAAVASATPSISAADGARAPVAARPAPAPAGGRAERRVAMTRLRARIAERMVQAQSTAAILTSFNEVDLAAVKALRERYREAFEKEHGARLGLMSFFVRAAVEALKRYPVVNASVEGNDIVYHEYYDIGVAVSTPRGLVVPVLRDAEHMNFATIETTVADYATRARDGSIGLDELTGGTFTITNGGVFGSLVSTPILNPPQSAILGMHKIQDRPIAVNGQVAIRPMMYIALSYDHRIIDGREAVLFLVSVKESLEDPARLLLQL